jgi:hypothetical protein
VDCSFQELRASGARCSGAIRRIPDFGVLLAEVEDAEVLARLQAVDSEPGRASSRACDPKR